MAATRPRLRSRSRRLIQSSAEQRRSPPQHPRPALVQVLGKLAATRTSQILRSPALVQVLGKLAATRPRLRSRSRRLIQASAEPQQRRLTLTPYFGIQTMSPLTRALWCLRQRTMLRMTEPQQRRIITLTRALRCLRQWTTLKFRRHPFSSHQRSNSTCLRVLEKMRAI